MPASGAASGGVGVNPTIPGAKAKLKRNHKAVAPASAPAPIKRAIAAANHIDSAGYRLGGGHGSWESRNYDCSGAVSYVLHKAGMLKHSMPSGSFSGWGKKGKGRWITVYADGGHAFMVIAGLRFDTSQPDDGDRGPGWSKSVKKGFVNVSKTTARHKAGY